MSKPKVWINGVTGRMGKKLYESTKKDPQLSFFGGSAQLFTGGPFDNEAVSDELLAKSLKDVDLIIDFSSPPANMILLEALHLDAAPAKKKILIGTTGLSDGCLKRWRDLAKERKHAVLFAPNTSMGILILSKILNGIASTCLDLGFDCEIVETHHREKVDAPSGTALRLAESVNDGLKKPLEIQKHHEGKRSSKSMGIHSIRGGDVFGEHEVRFIGQNEEVTLSHRAFNRDLFAEGAIKLTHWLSKQPVGVYNLDDVKLEDF